MHRTPEIWRIDRKGDGASTAGTEQRSVVSFHKSNRKPVENLVMPLNLQPFTSRLVHQAIKGQLVVVAITKLCRTSNEERDLSLGLQS